jgi:hypothetical protein
MVIYGESDDSPGAQFLGLILFIMGIIGIIKIKKKVPKSRPKNF